MNRRVLELAAGLGMLAGVGALAATSMDFGDGTEARPRLALLTSLPLMFGESFGLEQRGSPALTRLQQNYDVVAIAAADPAGLKGHDLLLMAHPRAQPAVALVELDRWVRDGGRVLLLADPKLDWPSELPLGDPLRAPPMFADTGLLGHWGLSLQGAAGAATAGELRSTGSCEVASDGLVAHCVIGKGRVTVIADADFINVLESGDPQLDLLADELDRLESR